MNKKSVNMKEKYFIPSLPILSPIILAINSYVDSKADWLLEGIIDRFLIPKYIKSIISDTVINMASDEFVNDIS